MRHYHRLLICALVVGACTNPVRPEKAENVDRVAPQENAETSEAMAKVGDVVIPMEPFNKLFEVKKAKFIEKGHKVPNYTERRYRKTLAERLIYQEVLRQEAKKLGLEYDENAVQERLERHKSASDNWNEQLKRRGETEESIIDTYIADAREELILEHRGSLNIKPEEIQTEYARTKKNWVSDKPRARASHILIPISDDVSRAPKPVRSAVKPKTDDDVSAEERAKQEAEALAKAEEIYALATAEGADFATLAEEYSIGSSALKGGDIGIFTADRMAEEFSKAAFALEVGDVSKPIKTRYGYHIIKLTGKWPAGELPLEALEDQIKRRLGQRKLSRGRKDLRKDLLASYDIEDHIKPTLGPVPKSRRPMPRNPMGNPHGNPHGAPMNPHGNPHGAPMNPHGNPHGVPMNPHGAPMNPHGAGKPMPSDSAAPADDKAAPAEADASAADNATPPAETAADKAPAEGEASAKDAAAPEGGW